jgi:hypothetical protein
VKDPIADFALVEFSKRAELRASVPRGQRIDIRTVSLRPPIVEVRCGCGHFRAEASEQLSAIEAWNTHALEAGHPDGWALFVDAIDNDPVRI